MSEGEIPPERLAEAEELVRRLNVRVPYPSREATDLEDAVLLRVAEGFADPEWVARFWLGGSEEDDRER